MLTRERRVSCGCAWLSGGTAEVLDEICWRTGLHVRPAQMKQLWSFHLKNKLVSLQQWLRGRAAHLSSRDKVEMGHDPAVGGTWPPGVALHTSLCAHVAMDDGLCGFFPPHHGHRARVCVVPNGSFQTKRGGNN